MEEVLKGLRAGCERLVHPSVRDPEVRDRQSRLIGLLLAAPLFVCSAMAVLFPPAFGPLAALSLIGAGFTLAWTAAALVALSGSRAAVEPVMLGLAVPAAAGIVAAGGGLASPVLMLALALPFEAAWLARSRRAASVGAAAALAVICLQAPAGALASPGASASAWQWLLPLAYAALALPRAMAWLAEVRRESVRPSAPSLDELIDAVEIGLGPTGEVIDVSLPARRIVGVAPALLMGDGLFDRIHVADRISYLGALADLRHGAGRQRVELRLRAPADRNGPGAYRPFLLDMMRGDDETVVAVLRSNEEVAALRASLAATAEEREKLAIDRNRALAAVSHELRTPLNAIIGFTDMLQCEMFGPFRDPRQQEYVGLIAQSGRHLLDVVNSLLDVTRLESGSYAIDPQRFRFADAVETSTAMLGPAAGARGVGVSTRIESAVGEIDADRHAVQRMLINLLSNAIKFTPEGGSVTVGARRAGSRLVFWVSDTGIGIGADDLALIGRPFVQVQNDRAGRAEGAGLGLSLVKGLVALHDGTMDIESEAGQGTTVTIGLPLDGPAKGAADRPSAIVRLPGKTPGRASDGTFRKTA